MLGAGVLALGIAPVARAGDESKAEANAEAAVNLEALALRDDPEARVPPLPPLDAPKRPYRQALLHLMLLEAEFYESLHKKVLEGTFDQGEYNEMYEFFFRPEYRRLSAWYPDARADFEGDEALAAARRRNSAARQKFQAARFIAEQQENSRRLGLDPDERSQDEAGYEERAIALMNAFAEHYRRAETRVRDAAPEELEDVNSSIRTDGLHLTRRLRQLTADFPTKPRLFDGALAEESLQGAQAAMLEALDAFQSARKEKEAEAKKAGS